AGPGEGCADAGVFRGPQEPRVAFRAVLGEHQGPGASLRGTADQRQPGGAGAVQLVFGVEAGAEDPRRFCGDRGPPEEAAVAGPGTPVGRRAANAQVPSAGVAQPGGDVESPRVGAYRTRGPGAFLPQQFCAVRRSPRHQFHEVCVIDCDPGHVALAAVVVEHDGAAVPGEGAATPETHSGHVGDRDADPQVVPVVVGVDLGDGGLAEGGDRVQVGARGEGGGDVGAVAVAGDDGAAHREGCWSWGRIGHGATSVIDAQGASSSENRAMWEALRWTSSSMPDTMRRVPSAVTDTCWADSGMGRGSGAHRTASRTVMKPRVAS